MSLYRLLQNPHVYKNPDYKAISELISFDGIQEYAHATYPSPSEDVLDEPSNIVVPDLEELQSLDSVKTLGTMSTAGLVLSAFVTLSFGVFLLKSRSR